MRIVAFVCGVILCLGTCTTAGAEERWRVPFILPLTGDAAAWGVSFRQGSEFALSELAPKTRERLHIIFDDDQLSSKQSLTVLHELLSAGAVTAVVNISSSTGNALAAITEPKKIPLLSVSSDQAISRGRRYAFNFWVTPEAEATTVIAELERRNMKRIARIYTTQSGVIAFVDAFDRENRGRIDVTLSQDFAGEIRDFRSFLPKLRAKQSKTDGILTLLLPGQIGLFAKQLRDARMKIPLFGVESIEDANEVKIAEGALEGVWYVNAATAEPSFSARFLKMFPDTSSMVVAAAGYDSVKMLALALESGVSSTQLHEFFHHLKDYRGALGKFSSTGDGRFTLPAEVKVVRNGKFEPLGN